MGSNGEVGEKKQNVVVAAPRNPNRIRANLTSQLAMVTPEVVHWDFSNAARTGLPEMGRSWQLVIDISRKMS
jgi:hypothetical protein